MDSYQIFWLSERPESNPCTCHLGTIDTPSEYKWFITLWLSLTSGDGTTHLIRKENWHFGVK